MRLKDNPAWWSWFNMIQRCTNPKAIKYPSYGGRGIAVCTRWLISFSDFLDDMGPRPEGTSIDRIDTYGDYEPGNCRWATIAEQAANKRPYKTRADAGVPRPERRVPRGPNKNPSKPYKTRKDKGVLRGPRKVTEREFIF